MRLVLGFCVAWLLIAPAKAETMSVVTTTGMIADAAMAIGGDTTEVKSLMGPGVDPHAYRQTRSDIVSLAKADLVLWHGLYLEAQMEDLLLELDGSTNVVAVAEGLERQRLIADEEYENRFDPHVWMDPNLWQDVVTVIRDAMIDVRPDRAELFEKNAADYLKRIEALSIYATEAMASVPEESRVLVTAHDAFNYFGNAYGFDVIGIQGISTESEAGLNRIAELVDLLVERNVGAVFVESSVSDRNIKALIEGANARGHKVSIGGELFSDAMGEDGSYEGTYIGMIDHNTTTITRSLGGDAPDKGKNGLLRMGS